MRGLWLALGAIMLSPIGCEMIATVDRSTIVDATSSGGGGATATTTTTTVTTGTGGTGGSAPECASDADCPDPGSECLTRACTADFKCVPVGVAAGTPVAAQKVGDCQIVVCDGSGATKSQADDTDHFVDGFECTTDVCTDGVPSNPPRPIDTACGKNGKLFCNATGSCIGCNVADQCGATTDCATPLCTNGVCSTSFAIPGTAVPGQTAGDCQEVQCDGLGGTKSVADNGDVVDDGKQCTGDVCVAGLPTHPNAPSGKPCTEGMGQTCDGAGTCVGCLSGADCPSFVCTGQVCAAATCVDSVKNATETDIDCGGAGCAACVDGKHCAAAADCASSVCSGNPLTCQVPSCTDGAKNASETDVDCGGMCATKCAPTKACLANTDCVGGSCVGNTCVPTCTDLAKNGAETDVDCGGMCAAKCGPTKACMGDADCVGGSCIGNVCVPSCSDAVKNGGEADVDCGGPCATKCADGKACTVGSDCVALSCNGNVCGPSCFDAVKNGTETDVDCGGGVCATCANGKTCLVAANCASGLCNFGLCAAVDNEPTNNTCAGASAEPLPLNLPGLQLPNVADVDWFMFTATAADVGKVVHVVTTSAGVPPCDTVVEVFTGSCAALATLGGPSDDNDYSENWLSDPIVAAGPFWVKVSYSSFGFSSAPYTLSVTTQ